MMTPSPLLQLTPQGLYCAEGDFHVDPWTAVERAVVTHAHADHATRGCGHYLIAEPGLTVARLRLGSEAPIDTLPYGQLLERNGVRVSLHPAGHIIGSAQVRLEHQGEVWVFSGDYKREPDPTCTLFEPVRCHTFITESTFGLPIYRWPATGDVFERIHAWWRRNQEAGKASLLLGYALGKAQRLLAGLDPALGPLFTHGAVEKVLQAYREAGVRLPATLHVGEVPSSTDWTRALILAPPSAHGTPWTRRFRSFSTGMASGWMRLRGTRRRRAIDQGFVLSDHADWPALLAAIQETGAERVMVTHGYAAILARWLTEQGLSAQPLTTHFEGEVDEEAGELPPAALPAGSQPEEEEPTA